MYDDDDDDDDDDDVCMYVCMYVCITEILLFCRQLERYWQVYFYHDSMPK